MLGLGPLHAVLTLASTCALSLHACRGEEPFEGRMGLHCAHVGSSFPSQVIILSLQVRDWYVESFKELRNFRPIRDADSELQFTGLLKHIYHRHRSGLFRENPCSRH